MKTIILSILLMGVFLSGCVNLGEDTNLHTQNVATSVPTRETEQTSIPDESIDESIAESVASAPTEETEAVEIAGGGGVWDESDYLLTSPVIPQPGDTAESWNPQRAEFYPNDKVCTDLELLEKWMAVEGLSFEDLDERGCAQLILTVAQETDGVGTVTVCYERQLDGDWSTAEGFSRMYGWLGGNGIMHGRLRETNTSPAGLWSLGTAFGNEDAPGGIKMPWRNVTSQSDWVCDADSPYFNTWQERGTPGLDKWSDDVEHLENYAKQYAYACVIRFNTAPYTVPERGCAIFLHCSTGATGGCVGLVREDMLRLLLWLDPEKAPHILITGYQLYENVDAILG